jgi:predicted NAD/FAD-binding protein
MTRIAIVGAGFSGLKAANIPKNYAEIAIFEKRVVLVVECRTVAFARAI